MHIDSTDKKLIGTRKHTPTHRLFAYLVTSHDHGGSSTKLLITREPESGVQNEFTRELGTIAFPNKQPLREAFVTLRELKRSGKASGCAKEGSAVLLSFDEKNCWTVAGVRIHEDTGLVKQEDVAEWIVKLVEDAQTVSPIEVVLPIEGDSEVGCAVCRATMPGAQVVSFSVLHGYDMSRADIRLSSTMSVHRPCWEQLVQELFPPTCLQGSCPACSANRLLPSASLHYPYQSEWTCAACGHPCSLGRKPVGWCCKCKLPIVPGLHRYWFFVNGDHLTTFGCHQQCVDVGKMEVFEHGTWRLREAGDTRPPEASFWEQLF